MEEPIVELTDAARQRLRRILEEQGRDAVGIRLGVRPSGCSGYSYAMDFARRSEPGDVSLEFDGVRLLVAADAVAMLRGTRIDWHEDRLMSRFVFDNPNEKARCGCGESFAV